MQGRHRAEGLARRALVLVRAPPFARASGGLHRHRGHRGQPAATCRGAHLDALLVCEAARPQLLLPPLGVRPNTTRAGSRCDWSPWRTACARQRRAVSAAAPSGACPGLPAAYRAAVAHAHMPPAHSRCQLRSAARGGSCCLRGRRLQAHARTPCRLPLRGTRPLAHQRPRPAGAPRRRATPLLLAGHVSTRQRGPSPVLCGSRPLAPPPLGALWQPRPRRARAAPLLLLGPRSTQRDVRGRDGALPQ